MDQTVYIVTAGEYSDYRIVAAFTTRERAEAYLGEYNCPTGRIQEYELDRAWRGPPRDWAYWTVCLGRSGEPAPHRPGGEWVYCQGREDYVDPDDEVSSEPHILRRPLDKPPGIEVHCWARDREHAIKIANDIRSRLVATDRWLENDHAPKPDG
jgi:hypothetical protein